MPINKMYPFVMFMAIHVATSSQLVDMNDTVYYKASMDFPGYPEPEIDTKLQNKLELMCLNIKDIDTKLSYIMVNGTKGDGERLLKELKAYNEVLQQLLDSAKKHKLPTLCAAEDILEKGGPKFMDFDVEKEKLLENLQWSDGDYQKLVDLQKVTFRIWSVLFGINNNFP